MCEPRTFHRAPWARRGFTAVEVLLAMCLAGFIGLCVLSMTAASSQIWSQQEESSGIGTTGVRTRAYLERVLRSAQDVGYWAEGSESEPAAMLLWAHDDGTRQPDAYRDHQLQQCELLLVRHDPEAGQIKLYRSKDYALLTPAEQLLAKLLMTSSAFNTRAAADAFAASAWVEEHTLAGNVGETVENVSLNVDRTGENPIVWLRFDLVRGGLSQTVNVTVSLRVRDKKDDWTRTILQLGLLMP